MEFNVKDKHLYDNARVKGNAMVYGSAIVFGNARVEGNARVYDNAWVSGNAIVEGNAIVFDNARVKGNAMVYGSAIVFGNAVIRGEGEIKKTSDYLVIGPAKSSNRFTTAHIDRKIGVRVNCGCFSGSLNEFSEAIEKTHKDNKEHLEQYRLFCQLIAFNFGVKE